MIVSKMHLKVSQGNCVRIHSSIFSEHPDYSMELLRIYASPHLSDRIILGFFYTVMYGDKARGHAKLRLLFPCRIVAASLSDMYIGISRQEPSRRISFCATSMKKCMAACWSDSAQRKCKLHFTKLVRTALLISPKTH